MYFRQHYLACLSQASYLVGDETTGRAVVVDPRRDVSLYLDEAAGAGLAIERVIETHVHADFLSGHLELAQRTGAVISYGQGVEVDFAHAPLGDGQRLSLGEVTLEVLATPGHTPESICLVVYEHADDPVPFGVLTGDTLFVGDVGRPDLLAGGGDGLTADVLARRLYHSVQKLLRLPDATRVFPAHGPGSSCGRQLGSETSSTIGEQRTSNYALQPMTEDEFVAAVTEGQSVRPGYFAFDAVRNRQRHELFDESIPPPLIDLETVLRAQAAGAVLLDTRAPDDFAAAHLHGAINVGLDGRFAEWAAWVLDPERDVVLVGDETNAAEAKVRLGRVGYDRVVGQLANALDIVAELPELVEASQRIDSGALARMITGGGPHVIDVRAAAECADGAIPGSRNIPLAALSGTLDAIEPGPVVLACASGRRSVIAASVLRAAGFDDVADLRGGFDAWTAAGLPIEQRPAPESLTVRRADPRNLETPLRSLGAAEITPTLQFYVRNNFRAPILDPATWRLAVAGLVADHLQLSLDDLRAMPTTTIEATLECAGNGRSSFQPPVTGEQWGLGAAGTARWTGVPLAAILDRAGVEDEAVEVVFRGADRGIVDDGSTVQFERSMPIGDVATAGVLLALEMNGAALTLDHGFPVRVVVPGWYGMASVKWLTDVEVVGEPFSGYFQTQRYVLDSGEPGAAGVVPLCRQRVRSLIVAPEGGETVRAGEVAVRGLAWSGTGAIADVSIAVGDGPWQPAELVGTSAKHRWQPWVLKARIERRGPVTIRARATDTAGESQPDAPRWNRLGYAANAIHAVTVDVR